MNRAPYTVKILLEAHGSKLGLRLLSDSLGLSKVITIPEAHRPGIALSGYLKNHTAERILVFGKVEMSYLKDLSSESRQDRLCALLTEKTPAVIVCGNLNVPSELIQACSFANVCLFKTKNSAMDVIAKLSYALNEDFAPQISCHGTLVEAFGVGVLIQGESSIGKSEAALGLIERGHRLVSDDVVKIRLLDGSYLEGSGPELTRHVMEIRGIGIINVAHLYGAVCIRDRKKIDLVIKLEEWDDKTFYDRVGLDEKYIEFLGIDLPFHILPVKPGRDLVLLIETIVLNHRLKEMGYNSAKEFNVKLLQTIAKKQRLKDGMRESVS